MPEPLQMDPRLAPFFEKDKKRCHFSSVISATLRGTWALLTALLYMLLQLWGNAELSLFSYAGWAVLILLALVALIFVTNFVRWRKTFIYFDEENLVVDRRLKLSAHKQMMRPRTIASTNLKQSLLDRLFGTYRLQFDIDSAATADKTDFQLVFSKRTAEALKGELERRRALYGQPAATAADNGAAVAYAPPVAEMEVIRKFSFGQVVRHAILTTPMWSIIYTVISVPLMLLFLLGDLSLQNLTFASLLTVILALWPVLLQTVAPFFRYYGFTLSRRGKEVIVTCGLLTKQNFTLPLDKTNAIFISQPLLARFFGYGYGEIINVGMGDSEQGIRPAFSLLVPMAELQVLLAQVAPQFDMRSKIGRQQASPRAALPVLLLHYGLWGLALLAVSGIFSLWWLGVLVLLFLEGAAIASWKTKGLFQTEDMIVITSGVFARKMVITYYAKLQNIRYNCSLLARRAGVVHGMVTILAGVGHRTNSIGYFRAEEFEYIAQSMLRHENNLYVGPAARPAGQL